MATFTHTEDTKLRIAETKKKSNIRGELHGQHKLNSDNVKRIVYLHRNEHISHRRLAEMFKVSKGTITSILMGWTWSHITGISGERKRKKKTDKTKVKQDKGE